MPRSTYVYHLKYKRIIHTNYIYMYMSSCKSEYRVSASVALFDGLYLKLSSPSLLSTVEAAQHSHAEAGKHHQQQEPKSAEHYHMCKS